MNQKWKILIIVSLLLNVLLVGAFIGRATFEVLGPKPGFYPPMGPPTQANIMGLVLEKHSHERQKIEQQIQDLRQQAHAILLQKAINKKAYDNLMVELNKQFELKFKLMNTSIYEVASELSLKQRKSLVDELNRPPMRMPPPPRFRDEPRDGAHHPQNEFNR